MSKNNWSIIERACRTQVDLRSVDCRQNEDEEDEEEEKEEEEEEEEKIGRRSRKEKTEQI